MGLKKGEERQNKCERKTETEEDKGRECIGR